MTADDIVRLLAAKHHGAVFIAECNTGSSWNSCHRLDAWALLKTWTPITAIGYEVKVTRSDFLRDNKWTRYLSHCHEFYFVCPKGLIQPEDLPEHVGLLWATAGRLVTKRKAPRRQPEDLVDVMAYALMSRTRVVANMHEAARADDVEIWKEWLARKVEKQSVGHAASKRLREIVSEAKRAQQRAESERDRLQGVKDTLEALGFDGDVGAWTVKNAAAREPLFAALAHVKRQLRQIDLGIDRALGPTEAKAVASEFIA